MLRSRKSDVTTDHELEDHDRGLQFDIKTDNVFSDGYSLQLGTISGSIGSDPTAGLTVPV